MVEDASSLIEGLTSAQTGRLIRGESRIVKCETLKIVEPERSGGAY